MCQPFNFTVKFREYSIEEGSARENCVGTLTQEARVYLLVTDDISTNIETWSVGPKVGYDLVLPIWR
jgi:hypothetical protein